LFNRSERGGDSGKNKGRTCRIPDANKCAITLFSDAERQSFDAAPHRSFIGQPSYDAARHCRFVGQRENVRNNRFFVVAKNFECEYRHRLAWLKLDPNVRRLPEHTQAVQAKQLLAAAFLAQSARCLSMPGKGDRARTDRGGIGVFD
jgi:hypothetical protein